MKNLTIGKRIAFGFAAVLVLVAILAVSAVLSLHTIHKTLPMITEDSLPGVTEMAQIRSLSQDIHIDTLKHRMLTTAKEKEDCENDLHAKEQELTKVMDEYATTVHLEEDRQNNNQLKVVSNNYFKTIDPLLEMSRAGKMEELAEYRTKVLLPSEQALSATVAKMFKWNADFGVAGATKIDHVINQASVFVSVLSLVAFITGIGCAGLIAITVGRVLAEVSDTLNEGANQVVGAASQVSGSSQSLAEGASEQAASIEETSSSLEEMASMTRRNAENARNANELAKQAREAADKGVNDMRIMSAAMEAIKVSSNDISKIIKTIDEIAFQTNILALNAAVEAARAGEAGMGFAVVADEVRSLAQRSAAAAKETADKIEGAIAKTGQGVEINSKVATALNDIMTKVRQVDELVTEVASASREQTEGITQINTAVGQMDKVTQSNASNAEECAAAAEELNAQAGVMKHSVNELLQLVGNARQPATIHYPGHSLPAKEIRGTVPLAKHSDALQGNKKSNGHVASLTMDKHRETIPLEGDFKDF